MLNNIMNIAIEVLTGLFNNESNEVKEQNNTTYDYWMTLTYQEQEEYFNNNEYLKDYIKNDFYPNDRNLTAKHVQQIADKLNREFTNKFNRY
jgi:SLT domain-containing protein